MEGFCRNVTQMCLTMAKYSGAFFVDSSNFRHIFLVFSGPVPMQSQWEWFCASSPRVFIGFRRNLTQTTYAMGQYWLVLYFTVSIFARFAGLWRFNMGVYGKLTFKSLLLPHLSMDMVITGHNCSLPWSNTGLCFFRRFVKFPIFGEFS